jgi:hypothetical protein
MTAFVLPEIDRSTVDELRKKFPNLSEIELPKMEHVGKSADEAVDRLLGRSKSPVWPWVAAGIGLVAVIGAIAAYFAWFRRPAWDSTEAGWTADSTTPEAEATLGSDPMLDGTPAVGTAATEYDPTRYPVEEA